MAYGLRKIYKSGIHYGFQWPLEVGAVVTAPDWNPEAVCGGGLHFLHNASGDYFLLKGYYWAVIEYDESKIVHIDNRKAKVESCKIVYLSEQMPKFFDWFTDLSSGAAYNWACAFPEDRKHMKQFVTDSQHAYLWARDFPDDRNMMRQFVTDSSDAYYWAVKFPEDREHMKQFINDSYDAYYWVKQFPEDREHMKQFITTSYHAYSWTEQFPEDREHMRQFVNISSHAYDWIKKFPDDREHFENLGLI